MSSKRSLLLSGAKKILMVIAASLVLCSDLTAARRRRARRWIKKRAVYSHVLMNQAEAPFSKTYAKIFSATQPFPPQAHAPQGNVLFWEEHSVEPFREVLFSWNARRPRRGKFTFYAAIEHNAGKPVWHRFAEWGGTGQKTFGKKAPFVITSYSHIRMCGTAQGKGFRVKVVAEEGADIKDMHALFACTSDFHKYRRPGFNLDMPSVIINNVPRQSQFRLDHPRYKDLCSPTSTSMIVRYFSQKNAENTRLLSSLHNDAVQFADNVHDKSLNIYGNYPLNVAQAYDSAEKTNGNVFFRVERLHGPKHLYSYLTKQIPVAVSVRGWIPGAAHVYRNGHFIVVVGWDNVHKRFLCIDPAFRMSKKLFTSYSAKDFLAAWRRSQHLSYIPIPKNAFGFPQTTPAFAREAERLSAEREAQPMLESVPETPTLTARADIDLLSSREIVV